MSNYRVGFNVYTSNDDSFIMNELKIWLDEKYHSRQFIAFLEEEYAFPGYDEKDLQQTCYNIYEKLCSIFPDEDLKVYTTSTFMLICGKNIAMRCSILEARKQVKILSWGNLSLINKLKPYTSKEKIHSVVKWHYLNFRNEIQTKEIEINQELEFTEEFYPYIACPVKEYYKKYKESTASILILMGEPGTGKTSFVRKYIEDSKSNCYYTFDDTITKNDKFYIDFLTDKSFNLLVVEDADLLLSSRELSNTAMSKFLNASEGLVKIKDKKIIFTTNLQKVNSIDDAIMRPGRCFDVLNFRKLTTKEANIVCEKYNMSPLPEKNSGYSIGDIFHREAIKKRKISGFLD